MAQVSVERNLQGIVTCWIDSPRRRNALTDGMLGTLADTMEQAGRQQEVRAIFVRGRGGSFCSGRDLQELDPDAGETGALLARRIAPAERLANAVRHCAVPTVAVVDGKAAGLGVALASWCDLAVACDTATFLIPEARVGIAPSFTLVSLTRAIGRRAALDLCMTGRSMDAAEAARLGLVQRVCDPASLEACVDALAASFIQASPQALRHAKALLDRVDGLPPKQALVEATATAIESMQSEDASEGMAAFRARRPPTWAAASIHLAANRAEP